MKRINVWVLLIGLQLGFSSYADRVVGSGGWGCVYYGSGNVISRVELLDLWEASVKN